jgi:hypothetical protein
MLVDIIYISETDRNVNPICLYYHVIYLCWNRVNKPNDFYLSRYLLNTDTIVTIQVVMFEDKVQYWDDLKLDRLNKQSLAANI